MTDRDTAAALANALPAGISYGDLDEDGWRLNVTEIAAVQAERLAEAGWVLVRPDDEATVERVARALVANRKQLANLPVVPEETRDAYRRDARVVLAALAAPRPGTADTAQDSRDRCPRCGSPDPKKHPAVQFEGEVQVCPHPRPHLRVSELDGALHDWAERVSVEASAGVRAGSEAIGMTEEHWDLVAASAFAGAALALKSVVAVDGLDSNALRRLVKETP